jgi:hypothetical protein
MASVMLMGSDRLATLTLWKVQASRTCIATVALDAG